MMNKVDIKQWERREAYEFFADYEMPYIQITTRLDLRNLVVLIKEMNLSFYGVMTYMVLIALNEIEAFHFVHDFSKTQPDANTFFEKLFPLFTNNL